MKGILVGDKEQMVIDRDEHHVFCRPKHYVDSSGTTWANEEMELRHVSTIYDVKTSQYSSQFMQLCRRLRDDSFYYLETNIKQDYTKSNVHEIYTTCEKKRIEHLKNRLAFSLDEYNFVQEKQDTEVQFIVDVLKPNKIQLLCDTLYRMLSENNIIDYRMLGNDHQNLVGSLQQMVQQIEELELPPQKTRQCIRSDSGPGVGSNNHEVKFRMAEIARITNDYIRIILHGSRGDSGQNEAEQTNSGVSNMLFVMGAQSSGRSIKDLKGLPTKILSI